jgi:hypothetical protein
MQDWVSIRGSRTTSLVVSVGIIAPAVYASSGSPWMGLTVLSWVVLAISGSMWLGRRSRVRSVQQMIADLEGEPILAVARAQRAHRTIL